MKNVTSRTPSRATYMKRYRQRKVKALPNDSVQRDIDEYILIDKYLAGTATALELVQLDKCHASYGPGGFTYVGPMFGPYTITDPDLARGAFSRVVGVST